MAKVGQEIPIKVCLQFSVFPDLCASVANAERPQAFRRNDCCLYITFQGKKCEVDLLNPQFVCFAHNIFPNRKQAQTHTKVGGKYGKLLLLIPNTQPQQSIHKLIKLQHEDEKESQALL